MIHKYKIYIFNMLGIFMLLYYIWFRFICERLPKDIPFNLTLIGFTILSFICLTYVYAIYKMYKPSLSTYWKNVAYSIAKPIINALLQFNQFLLSYKRIQQIMKILLKLLYMLFKIQLLKDGSIEYIHLFIKIIPKTIFVVCLIIDCFYLEKLYLIYTCIIIITFPLFVLYLLYTYEIIKIYDTDLIDKYFIIEITSKDILYAESDFDDEGSLKPGNPTHFINPSDLDYDSLDYTNKYKYLKALKFIDYQQRALICENTLYEYKILFLDERKDVIYLENPLKPIEINKDNCNDLLQFHIKISALKDTIIYGNEFFTNDYLTLHKLLITINLICWSYILFVSLYNLDNNIFESIYVENIYNVDPFSDTCLISSFILILRKNIINIYQKITFNYYHFWIKFYTNKFINILTIITFTLSIRVLFIQVFYCDISDIHSYVRPANETEKVHYALSGAQLMDRYKLNHQLGIPPAPTPTPYIPPIYKEAFGSISGGSVTQAMNYWYINRLSVNDMKDIYYEMHFQYKYNHYCQKIYPELKIKYPIFMSSSLNESCTPIDLIKNYLDYYEENAYVDKQLSIGKSLNFIIQCPEEFLNTPRTLLNAIPLLPKPYDKFLLNLVTSIEIHNLFKINPDLVNSTLANNPIQNVISIYDEKYKFLSNYVNNLC